MRSQTREKRWEETNTKTLNTLNKSCKVPLAFAMELILRFKKIWRGVRANMITSTKKWAAEEMFLKFWACQIRRGSQLTPQKLRCTKCHTRIPSTKNPTRFWETLKLWEIKFSSKKSMLKLWIAPPLVITQAWDRLLLLELKTSSSSTLSRQWRWPRRKLNPKIST